MAFTRRYLASLVAVVVAAPLGACKAAEPEASVLPSGDTRVPSTPPPSAATLDASATRTASSSDAPRATPEVPPTASSSPSRAPAKLPPYAGPLPKDCNALASTFTRTLETERVCESDADCTHVFGNCGIGECGGAVAKTAEMKLEALKDEYAKLGCHAKRPAPCAKCVVPSVSCTKKRCADRLPE